MSAAVRGATCAAGAVLVVLDGFPCSAVVDGAGAGCCARRGAVPSVAARQSPAIVSEQVRATLCIQVCLW